MTSPYHRHHVIFFFVGLVSSLIAYKINGGAMLTMLVLSIIVGQKYMQDCNKELKDADDKLHD